MKLILLVCLVGTAYSSEQETINGHLDFTHSDRSLNEYYPDLKTAIELPVLRYTYDWRNQGLEDSLVIPLYDCTSELCSKCVGQETALLVEVKDWELVCQVLPFHVTMAEQRSTGTEEEDEEDGNASLQQSNGELTGGPAARSSAGLIAGLQAQNTAEDQDPEEETEEPESIGADARSLDAASATTAAPAATFVPNTNSNEADQSSDESDASTEVAAAPEATEAPAAAPKAVPTTTKAATTTTTEASTEAAKPSIVTAAIEQKEAGESEDTETIEATTEAINSPIEEADTEASESQDEPESDVGQHDDDFTLEPEDKSSSDHQTETEEDKKQEDHDEDVEVAGDEPSSNGEKEHEPDQIHLSEGVRSDEGDDWRAKYYTILGFFICFLIVFVIVVLFVIIKMKQRRAAPPTMIGATTGNVSPGPALERSFHTGDENEPLTPAVPAGASHSTFKFDGTKTHTPLPR